MLLRRLTVYSSCNASAFNAISLSLATQVWTHVSFAHGANGVLQASCSALLGDAMRYDVDVRLARAGLREWRAGSVGDVWRAADVQLGCVALGEVAARTSACVPAPLYFGPPNSLNPWGNNRVATNIQIRDLQMFTTALQQRDVQQIMIGGRRRAELAVVDCGVFATCVASTGSFGVYECPAGGYCPPNSSAPTGARARLLVAVVSIDCCGLACAGCTVGATCVAGSVQPVGIGCCCCCSLDCSHALNRSIGWRGAVVCSAAAGFYCPGNSSGATAGACECVNAYMHACLEARWLAGWLAVCADLACVQCVRRAATVPAQVRHVCVCLSFHVCVCQAATSQV